LPLTINILSDCSNCEMTIIVRFLKEGGLGWVWLD